MFRQWIGAALVVLAMAAFMGGCGGGKDDGDGAAFPRSQADTVVELRAAGLQFEGLPSTVQGPKVFLEVRNESGDFHDLELLRAPGGEMMGRIEPFGPGEVRTLAVELPPGNYIARCQVRLIDAPHSDLGMLAELVVQ